MNISKFEHIEFFDFEEYENGVFYDIEWNRNLKIKVYFEKNISDKKDLILAAKRILYKIKCNENEIYEKSLNYLTTNNFLDYSENGEFDDERNIFLRPDSGVFIEFNADLSGTITYTVFMYGSLMINFDNEGNFKEAGAIAH